MQSHLGYQTHQKLPLAVAPGNQTQTPGVNAAVRSGARSENPPGQNKFGSRPDLASPQDVPVWYSPRSTSSFWTGRMRVWEDPGGGVGGGGVGLRGGWGRRASRAVRKVRQAKLAGSRFPRAGRTSPLLCPVNFLLSLLRFLPLFTLPRVPLGLRFPENFPSSVPWRDGWESAPRTLS